MLEENLEDQMGRQDKERRIMGKSRPGTDGSTVGKAKMEMDRPYITETTKQYHEACIAMEPSRIPKSRKAEGDMEKMCGER